jgi:hypothetical protein
MGVVAEKHQTVLPPNIPPGEARKKRVEPNGEVEWAEEPGGA